MTLKDFTHTTIFHGEEINRYFSYKIHYGEKIVNIHFRKLVEKLKTIKNKNYSYGHCIGDIPVTIHYGCSDGYGNRAEETENRNKFYTYLNDKYGMQLFFVQPCTKRRQDRQYEINNIRRSRMQGILNTNLRPGGEHPDGDDEEYFKQFVYLNDKGEEIPREVAIDLQEIYYYNQVEYIMSRIYEDKRYLGNIEDRDYKNIFLNFNSRYKRMAGIISGEIKNSNNEQYSQGHKDGVQKLLDIMIKEIQEFLSVVNTDDFAPIQLKRGIKLLRRKLYVKEPVFKYLI